MPEPRFTIPGAGVENGRLRDVLRLEVETDPDGLRNLIVNPDGRLGGYGWVSPTAGTLVRGAVVSGVQVLELVTASSSIATNYTSELVAVTAGQYVAARWAEQGFSSGTTGYYRARFEFVDAAGAAVSSSAQSAYYQNLTPGTVRAYSAVLVPATATRARLRFDAYSNTSAANPTTSRSYRFNEVAVATAATAAELGSTIRTNLITNPTATTNVAGWESGEATIQRADTTATNMNATESASMLFAMRSTALYDNAGVLLGETGYYDAQGHTVAAQQLVYVRLRVAARVSAAGGGNVFKSGTTLYLAMWEWNAGVSKGVTQFGTIQTLSSSGADANGWVYHTLSGYYTVPSGVTKIALTVSAFGGVTAGAMLYTDQVLMEKVPAGTTGTRSYFDGGTTDADGWVYEWTGTAGASTSTATSTTLDYFPPVPTVDVLNATHEIGVQRAALDPGTLNAEVLSASLDPATSALIRPGRAVRLLALDAAGAWSELYTGEVPKASSSYDLLATVDAEKRTRIALTATDNIAALASASRPNSVSTVASLPYVLEGAGVPWNVNGSGNQVTSATIRAKDDNATALDQVALTRDTAHGYAWVDRRNVLQVWDAAQLSTTPVLTLDESVYVEPVIDYDTDACINEVQVTRRALNSKGETVEVVTTYSDAASIAQWGRHRAEFVILAPTSAATFAAEVLAANATPTVRMSACTVNIKDASFLPVAHLDLYDAVTVVNTAKGINQLARVTGITHELEADKWMVLLEFGNPSSVASPQVVPPLKSPDVGPPLQRGTTLCTPSAANTTVSVNITFDAPMPQTPTVVATPVSVSNDQMEARVANVTTTGFTLGFRRSTATGTNVAWIAACDL